MTPKSAPVAPRKGGRPARAETERRHVAILDAAENIFLTHGFAGSSVDQIASEAETSKQTVYARFGTKEALFIAVSNRLLAQTFSASKAPVGSIRAQLISASIDILHAILDPKMVRMYSIIMAEADRFPELARLSDEDEHFKGRSAYIQILSAHKDQLRLEPETLRPAMLMLQDMLISGPLRRSALGLARLEVKDFPVQAALAVDIFLNGVLQFQSADKSAAH